MIGTFAGLIAAAGAGDKKSIAVPSPSRTDFEIVAQASRAGLVRPLFVGRGRQIEGMVKKAGPPFDHEIIDADGKESALDAALALAGEKRAEILMQGGLNRNAFLGGILDKAKGLRNKKSAGYISVFQLLKRDKLILVTDTFLNDSPGLGEKLGLLENAIELAAALGIDAPMVAALAAIEQVNPGIPSTLDAAILSKMSERKQFGRAIVEGPLDIDCALSLVAAERKGVKSPVTGNVDIYLVPEVDTGYLLAEMLVFFGKMKMIGMIAGLSVPVIVNLPFITAENRLAEIALACLAARKGGSDG